MPRLMPIRYDRVLARSLPCSTELRIRSLSHPYAWIWAEALQLSGSAKGIHRGSGAVRRWPPKDLARVNITSPPGPGHVSPGRTFS